jgi:hypothetical protein
VLPHRIDQSGRRPSLRAHRWPFASPATGAPWARCLWNSRRTGAMGARVRQAVRGALATIFGEGGGYSRRSALACVRARQRRRHAIVGVCTRRTGHDGERVEAPVDAEPRGGRRRRCRRRGTSIETTTVRALRSRRPRH